MKRTKHPTILLALAALGGAVSPASGHVTLEQSEALSGSYHKLVLQVPHGCHGSPTTAIRIRIPDGIASAKPQPKPGWTLGIHRVRLAQPMDAGHGRTVDEVVREVTWTGGLLPDEQFDEFRVMVKLPDRPGTTLVLPVVQECRQGVHRWIETARPGQAESSLKEPAPTLRLLPRP